MTTSIRRASIVLVLGMAIGCTLGPDPNHPPRTAADQARHFVGEPINVPPGSPPDDWWKHFADPPTERLVEQALANNLDLKAAASRVLQAQATLASARGARWPQADLSFSANRNKFSFVLPQVGRVGIFSTTYSGQLSISYQLDLFGRLARSKQAAWATLLATEADRRTVLNTLIAQVVRTRVSLAALERQLRIDRGIAESWDHTLRITEGRYRAGIVDATQLHLVRESAAAAEAAVPQVRRQVATTRHALDILVGLRPGTGKEIPQTLPPLPALDPVPLGLPASLLDRRPDLVAARMRFVAATAQVGVALANLYPNLSLSASAGRTGNKLNELENSNTEVYNAVLNVVAPLFHGGQLRAEVRRSRARAEEAAAQYAEAVLKALGEVEDALSAEEQLRLQLRAVQRQLQAARSAADLARWRYEAGNGQLLDLLVADRACRQAELALTTVRASLWDTRVGIFLALGGDWASSGRRSPELRKGQNPPVSTLSEPSKPPAARKPRG